MAEFDDDGRLCKTAGCQCDRRGGRSATAERRVIVRFIDVSSYAAVDGRLPFVSRYSPS